MEGSGIACPHTPCDTDRMHREIYGRWCVVSVQEARGIAMYAGFALIVVPNVMMLYEPLTATTVVIDLMSLAAGIACLAIGLRGAVSTGRDVRNASLVMTVMGIVMFAVSAWRHWDPLEVVILAATLFAAMLIYLRSRSPRLTEGC